MVKLLDYYENNGNPKFITANAQHAFMANNHVGAIAKAVRNFDNNTHSIEHYMVFGWEGLYEIGRLALPPLITKIEMTNYYNLADIPLNDSHILICDN